MKGFVKILLFLTLGLLLLSGTNANAITVSNTTSELFDASSGTRDVTISSHFLIQDVTIAIDFEKYAGETLGFNAGGIPYYKEIVFRLTSPANTTVNLIIADSFNSGTDGFRGIINFDDSASQVVNYDADSPHAGTFRPVGSLSAFNGQDASGTWSLYIEDTATADHLGFYRFDLTLIPVPIPPTVLMLGGGLIGLWGLRRKIRS